METSGSSPERVLAHGTAVGGLLVLPVTWLLVCAMLPVRDVVRGASPVVALRASSLTAEDWASLPILALMLVPAGAMTGLAVSGVFVMVGRHCRVPRLTAWLMSTFIAAGVMTALLVASAGPVLTVSGATAAAVVAAAAGPRISRAGRRSRGESSRASVI